MSLAGGTRLGPYEIISPLGAGGMGEVYLARDSRLERTVAIKVLPEHVSANPELKQRFEREAKTLAALSDPHICPVFDVGRDAGVDFLVMEYLEGETLAERLTKGPLPLADALRIAAEIAGALATAHCAGVIHRDLKPGNVMLTTGGSRSTGSGHAKLLDFGLARMARPGIAPEAMTSAPTQAAEATLTARGTILGTFQYMAPEQIEGDEADARTDIFAFGCVSFEMLTGRRAFEGKSAVSLLGAILKEDPPRCSHLQPLSPPVLDRIVQTCLAKNPDDRFQSAHDLRLQLLWVDEARPATGAPPAVIGVTARRERAIWAIGGLVLAALAGLAGWSVKRVPDSTGVVSRFELTLPEGQTFSRPGRHVVAISRDGTTLAYTANSRIYVRSLDQLEPRPLPGTDDDPMEPLFSPDGQWVAYFSQVPGQNTLRLRKVALGGGAPMTLAENLSAPFGASWAGGTIAFGVNDSHTHGIVTVPDAGGSPQVVAPFDPTLGDVSNPHVLDDRVHVMFSLKPPAATDDGQIVIQSIGSRDHTVIVNSGADPHLLATGHLLYIHDGTLFAVRFDAKRLQAIGTPTPVGDGVRETPTTRSGHFAISRSGTLVFQPGASGIGSLRTLVWMNRQGREQTIAAKPAPYSSPRLSPDGTKVALSIAGDLWVFDLSKETLTRVTSSPIEDSSPVWTPDGRSIMFLTLPGGAGIGADLGQILRKGSDGSGAESVLIAKAGGPPTGLSPDGKTLLFSKFWVAKGTRDIFAWTVDSTGSPRPLVSEPKADLQAARISPDGRWLAYQSTESGRAEIYVRPFPDVDAGRWQVSTDGGSQPRWARSGQELVYLHSAPSAARRSFMSVTVKRAPSFQSDRPQSLFEVPFTNTDFDVSADGARFLVVKNPGSAPPSTFAKLVVVSNWFDELRRKAH